MIRILIVVVALALAGCAAKANLITVQGHGDEDLPDCGTGDGISRYRQASLDSPWVCEPERTLEEELENSRKYMAANIAARDEQLAVARPLPPLCEPSEFQAMDDNGIWTMPHRCQRADGQVFWLIDRVVPWHPEWASRVCRLEMKAQERCVDGVKASRVFGVDCENGEINGTTIESSSTFSPVPVEDRCEAQAR